MHRHAPLSIILFHLLYHNLVIVPVGSISCHLDSHRVPFRFAIGQHNVGIRLKVFIRWHMRFEIYRRTLSQEGYENLFVVNAKLLCSVVGVIGNWDTKCRI